jgi:hypothetical protein
VAFTGVIPEVSGDGGLSRSNYPWPSVLDHSSALVALKGIHVVLSRTDLGMRSYSRERRNMNQKPFF